MGKRNSYIKGISYWLPPDMLYNEQLALEYNDWSSKKIYSKTGIASRHIAKNLYVSDMAVYAAEKLFDEYKIDKSTIDFILLCTQSPDYLLPTTACIVQERLELQTSCGAFDFNLGCSGYVYGLAIAKSLIAGGIANNILLITSEIYSHYINNMDKSTRTIFGDASTATIISSCEKETILKFVLGTDGKGASNLIVPAGGMKLPCSLETACEHPDESGSIRSQNNLYMNGPEIFNFTIERVPIMVEEALAKNNIDMQDIDLFIFHQANKFMMDYLREKIGVPIEKFLIYLQDTGNTVSNSIPIALKKCEEEGKLLRGMKLLLAGFGVGYSWGATIIDWNC